MPRSQPEPAYSEPTVVSWLQGIAGGALALALDNPGLAASALAYLQVEPAPAPDLPEGYLSPHFTLAELTRSDTADANGIDNSPDAAALDQLAGTAELLELVRAACGNLPVYVSSGYRGPQLNALVGGASNSAHVYGCAADFTVPDFGDVRAVCELIEPNLAAWGVDQLINESGGGAAWVHIGRPIPPSTSARCQCLTIANGVTTSGIA